MRRAGLALAAVLALAGTARAESPGEHLVGLFIQGCMPFVGDPEGLRAWAAGLKLPKLPDAGQAAFLQGQPGVVFDATDPGGKLVLVSGSDGNCDAIGQKHDPALVRLLEQGLARQGVALTVVADRADSEEKALHYREYVGRKGERGWRIIVSTGSPASGAPSMLSASPE